MTEGLDQNRQTRSQQRNPLADKYDELLVAHQRLLHEHRSFVAAHATAMSDHERVAARHLAHEAGLAESLRSREREVEAMRASTSWQITLPLRWLSGALLALRHRGRAQV